MNVRVFCLSLIALAFTSYSHAQLSGSLSGTLEADEYYVTGDLYVSVDQSLTIEPGTTLLFNGNYSFTINGTLVANGTETDSIHFIPFLEYMWGGIHFTETAADSSTISYALISGSGNHGVFIEDCSPTIRHSIITDCMTEDWTYGGGGICIVNSYSQVIDCIISDNSTSDLFVQGGGIAIFSGSPLVSNSVITDNSSGYDGGGIYIGDNSTAEIINCTISYNSTNEQGGGGIATEYSNPEINSCIIYENSVSNDCMGGGIHITHGECTIKYSVIYKNTSIEGAGIKITSGRVNIDHCTIVNNYGHGIYFTLASSGYSQS